LTIDEKVILTMPDQIQRRIIGSEHSLVHLTPIPTIPTGANFRPRVQKLFRHRHHRSLKHKVIY
jgi:hypothetical protein